MASRSSLIVIALLAACDRPDVLVICHNGNCVEPTQPELDDTIPALRESLALVIDGAPAIDGTELDSFWRGSDGLCLFAHDLDAERMTLIGEAADVVAEKIRAGGQLTHAIGKPFRIFFELKAHVGVAKSERHTPEQRTLHAQCAWSVYQTIATAAEDTGQTASVEFVFASFEPKLLAEVVAAEPASTPIEFKLDAFYGIPKPLDSETRPLSDYTGLPISIVEMHPQWIHDAQHEGLLSLDVEILFWMFSATTETFAAIEQYEPEMVVTSEANLMRRWLER
jgi:hypothetical protein